MLQIRFDASLYPSPTARESDADARPPDGFEALLAGLMERHPVPPSIAGPTIQTARTPTGNTGAPPSSGPDAHGATEGEGVLGAEQRPPPAGDAGRGAGQGETSPPVGDNQGDPPAAGLNPRPSTSLPAATAHDPSGNVQPRPAVRGDTQAAAPIGSGQPAPDGIDAALAAPGQAAAAVAKSASGTAPALAAAGAGATAASTRPPEPPAKGRASPGLSAGSARTPRAPGIPHAAGLAMPASLLPGMASGMVYQSSLVMALGGSALSGTLGQGDQALDALALLEGERAGLPGGTWSAAYGAGMTAAAGVGAGTAGLAASAVRQVAIAVERAVGGQLRHLTIQLSPEALGAIEIAVEFEGERRLGIAILAERPETLELLRGEARALERLLGQQGASLADSDLSFGLMGDGRGDRPARDGAARSFLAMADDAADNPDENGGFGHGADLALSEGPPSGRLNLSV